MPRSALIAAFALMAAACGMGSGLGVQGPPSAKSVAQSSSDFAGVQACPQSGPYERYLQSEKSKAADTYAADKKSWDDLKAAGANDSYIATYAGASADCDQFGSSNLSGKVAGVFAVRFKDSSSAAKAYPASLSQYHMTEEDLAQEKAFGATVLNGTNTGLGANSTVVQFAIADVTAYIAVWQKKEFVVTMITYNLPLTIGPAAATKINSRVR